MNVNHRLAVALACATLSLFSTSLFAVTGPVTTPPGGFTLTTTNCSNGACTFNSGTAGFTYGGFNFNNYRDLYWVPQIAETSGLAMAYDPASSNLAAGVAVWSSTSPLVVSYATPGVGPPGSNGPCNNVGYTVSVRMTATTAWVDSASLGLGNLGPAINIDNVPGGFHVDVQFLANGNPLSSTDGDHCTGAATYFTDGITAGNFFYTDVTPPIATKQYLPPTVQINGSSTVTYSIANSNPRSTYLSAGFNEGFPTGLAMSATPNFSNTCGGSFVLAGGGTAIQFSNANITPNTTCTISFDVTASTIGAKTSGYQVTTSNTAPSNIASATLEVLGPPTITKTFTPAQIAVGGTSTMQFTIDNPNDTTIDASFTDNLPAGLTFAGTPNLVNNCGGTVTPGSGVLTFSNGSLAIGQCTISIDVTSSADGVYNNSVTIDSTAAGTGNLSSASLTVANPPSIVKSFAVPEVPLDGTTTLTFTIQNPNVNLPMTGLAFTDNMPAGLVVAATPNVQNACGGTVTATAGGGTITLAGGGLNVASQCSVSVDVTGTTLGPKDNSVSVSSDQGAGNTSNATLNVSCTYALSSAGTPAPAAGMSGSFTVTTTASCAWTAISDSAWLTTSSSATGSGTVNYTVAGNTLTTQRVGTITVGGQTYTVTQSGVVPTGLVATATSTTSVALTWVSDPVDHFEVWRNDGSGFALIGSPTATNFTDTTATVNHAYAYKVRAVDTGANASAYTNTDIATTFVFTDDPLVSLGTIVKAVHITELRNAVNALRAVAGLAPATFTDDPLVSGTIVIKAVHILELRSALDPARSAFSLPAISYTTVASDTVVSALDVMQLRDGLR